jgi:hypothetical protein
MGFVAKAKIRDKAVGGSAFKKKGLIVKRSSGSLSERRETEVLYALKSIILDRVSPMFLDELRNEIDILRSMVRIDRREMLAGYTGALTYTLLNRIHTTGPPEYRQSARGLR